MARAEGLSERDRYRLIEVLDPELTHYEFFVARSPLGKASWENDETLMNATPERHRCIEGWPSKSFFNYDYQVVSLSDEEFAFMQNCKGDRTVSAALEDTGLNLEGVRNLQSKQLIMLTPAKH